MRDFVVREDGAREVLNVTAATSPMAVAILVDNTQAASDHIADIRRALASFVKALQGVGPRSSASPIARPSCATTPPIRNSCRTVSQGVCDARIGATLLDAVVEIGRGLQRREEDRAAMVILTTENTEFSTRHYKEILDALARGGADACRDSEYARWQRARRPGAQSRLGAG